MFRTATPQQSHRKTAELHLINGKLTNERTNEELSIPTKVESGKHPPIISNNKFTFDVTGKQGEFKLRQNEGVRPGYENSLPEMKRGNEQAAASSGRGRTLHPKRYITKV